MKRLRRGFLNILKNIKKYTGFIIACLIIALGIKIIFNFSYLLNIIKSFFNIVSPFIFAFIIAYILDPLVKLLNKKLKRWISILLTYTIVTSILALGSLYIFPNILSNISQLLNDMPSLFNKAELLIKNISLNLSNNGNINEIFSHIQNALSSILTYILTSTISTTIFIGKLLLGFLISIYVVIYKKNIIEFFRLLTLYIFKENISSKIFNFTKTLNSMFISYILIKGATSIIIGFISFIGLTIIGSPYSILLSIIITILNMIPYFGPFIGMAISFIVNLFFTPSKAVIVLIYLFLVQQFDAWILDPNTVGPKVGLNPLVALFAVTIGGGIAGPVGMLVSVPITATLSVYISKALKFNQK